MVVPGEIRQVERPVNTVVEGRTNKDGTTRYIVRERSGSTYSDGRSRPKNGRIVGYIIDGKYIEKTDNEVVGPDEVSMMTWAVERLALDLTPDVISDLRSVYSEQEAEMLYTMAILRVRHPDLRNSRMRRDYTESLLSETFPSLPMSKNSVSEFLHRIGSAGGRIRGFLRARCSRLPAGALTAVDGMLETDNSRVNNLSAPSRKTRVRGNREVSMLFAYSIDRMEPVCFSVYPGNMLDSKAYADFIEENDLRDAVLIGDKAFTVRAARSQFEIGRKMHYLFSIRRNAEVIAQLRLRDYDGILRTYTGVTYHVAFDVKNDVRYYSFRDAGRAAEEESAYLESRKKNGRGIDAGELAKLKPRWGTMIFQSDLDLSPEAIYEMYMQRWTIEEMFRLYKNIEDLDDTRVQSDFSVVGEHLVNFISTLITSRLMGEFLAHGLLDGCGYTEVMEILRRALRFRNDRGEWVFRAQTDREKEALRKLGLLPQLPPKRKPGRPRKNPQS